VTGKKKGAEKRKTKITNQGTTQGERRNGIQTLDHPREREHQSGGMVLALSVTKTPRERETQGWEGKKKGSGC